MIPEEILKACNENNYSHIREIDGLGVCAINRFLFTFGILVDIDVHGYSERYCYESEKEAVAALYAWNGKGYPPGNWIKHKAKGIDEPNPIIAPRCPFDDSVLLNVGALDHFGDGKDNHICPGCDRIWVDVDKEEWWTRTASVELLGSLIEGSSYIEITKVKHIH